jgi:hypothetical protein
MPLKPILFTALLSATLAAAALASAPALAQTNAEFAATTVSLSAIGDVKITPDRATLNLGVMAEAPNAADAMRQNASRMAAVIAALKSRGVPERSIRTQGLNLQAEYSYAPNQPQRLTGYRALNTVAVTVEDMDKVGGLLDAAVAAGANQINGVSFSLNNPAAAEDQARAEAIKALKAKAEVYAQANGLKVARLVRMSEGAGSQGIQPLGLNEVVVTGTRIGGAASPLPPVSAGEMDVRVQVNAVYELSR